MADKATMPPLPWWQGVGALDRSHWQDGKGAFANMGLQASSRKSTILARL